MSPRIYVGCLSIPSIDTLLRLLCVPHGKESTCSPYPAALCGDVDQSISGARLSEA
jgi:hypothetical protein